MENILSQFLQADFDWQLFFHSLLLLIFGSLILGVMGKFLFRRRSSLSHAISSAIGILFVYCCTVALSAAGEQWSLFVAPLPFVDISGQTLYVFSFLNADYTLVCQQLLSMVILAFLANLIEACMPNSKKLLVFVLTRVLTVVLAMALHLVVNYLMNTYLPQGIMTYAPVILLGLLIILLLVGALKFVVGALLMTVSPLIAAFYTFFFATVVGRQLTKAIFTTAILAAMVFGLNKIGCSAVPISPEMLPAYLPILPILLAVWYFVAT